MNRKNVIVGLAAVGLGFTAMYSMARNQSAAPRFGVCSPAGLLALLNPTLGAQNIPLKTAQATKGQAAPDWQFADLGGKPIKLSDFKGKVVVLNFWATWCPPCRKEIPALVSLQKQYGEEGLVVIGISLDQGGAAVVRSFADKMGISYPVAMADGEIASAYGVEAIPHTFIIDRAGNIAAAHQGDTLRDLLEADIKASL